MVCERTWGKNKRLGFEVFFGFKRESFLLGAGYGAGQPDWLAGWLLSLTMLL